MKIIVKPIMMKEKRDCIELWAEHWLEPRAKRPRLIEAYRNIWGELVDFRNPHEKTPFLIQYIESKNIIPEKIRPEDFKCTIGKGLDGRWYGWARQSITSFGPKDFIFEEDFGDEETKFTQHGTVEITCDAQAKQSAILFSDFIEKEELRQVQRLNESFKLSPLIIEETRRRG